MGKTTIKEFLEWRERLQVFTPFKSTSSKTDTIELGVNSYFDSCLRRNGAVFMESDSIHSVITEYEKISAEIKKQAIDDIEIEKAKALRAQWQGTPKDIV